MNHSLQSPSQAPAATFTAARIAAALGVAVRSVRRALADTPSDCALAVNGNSTAAWLVSSLPVRMQAQLREEAQRRGYASDEHLLKAPPSTWEPSVPLSKLDESTVSQAATLQRALRPTLERLHRDMQSDTREIIQEGLATYKKVVGHEITKRHLDRLIKRTLERDHGAESWDRLELFLPDRVAVKKAEVVPIGFDQEWRAVADACALFKDRANPTHNELCLFWDAAFTCLREIASDGISEKRARRMLRRFLESKITFIESHGRALEKLIARKLDRWIAGGQTAAAMADLRVDNSGHSKAVELSAEFRGKLLARAHQNGSLAQSWREAKTEGWMPPEVAEAYPFDWKRKSYVPAAIRRALGTDLAVLEPLQIGPKNARLSGPYITRDYAKLPSGRVFSADDVTMPIWFWIPDENGDPVRDEKGRVVVTRGQLLPWICARSQYIVTAQLIPEKGYDSVDILRGIARVHDEYGLPEMLYFERGIWESKLIDGSSDIRDRGPWSDYVYGLSEQGIKVRHAQPGNPRSKVVENVIGAIQRPTNRERGYCGRKPEECPEETKRQLQLVLSGREHPAAFFYSHPEALKMVERICNNFNEEPQNGMMLDGMSPREAFEKLRGAPPIQLPPQLRYLLARSRIETTVKANGVRVGKFFYKGEGAGRLLGQRVLAWFNPEEVDSICITDLRGNNPITLQRDVPVAAFDATPEEIEAAVRLNHAQCKHQRTLFTTLKKNFPEEFLRTKRQVVAPISAVTLGAEMETQHTATKTAAREQEKLRSDSNRIARAVGVRNGLRQDAEAVEAASRLAQAGVKAINPWDDESEDAS